MIDWKNKPEGAQRYNDKCANGWLKREGDVVSYYSDSGWIGYGNCAMGIGVWNRAIPEPSETSPLQLTWQDAPINATHILQCGETSKQGFAVRRYDGEFKHIGEEMTLYKMGDWFVVSERPECATVITVDSTINERGERYGKFNEGADIMQTLKNVMRETDGWERLTASQREALEMIQHKIGRVLNGDPTYDDNWRDICGYSQLILDELNGTER